MKLKQFTALFLCLSLLALCMAGCGSSAADSSATPAGTDSKAAEAVQSSTPSPQSAAQGQSAAEESTVQGAASAEESAAPELDPYTLPLTTGDVSFSVWCEGAAPTVASTLGADSSYNTSDATLYLEDLLGVHIDYVEYNMMSAGEEFNLMVASGDWSDVIFNFDSRYPGGSQVAYDDGVIMDLTDMVENDMPYYRAYLDANPDFEKLVTSDSEQKLFIPSLCEENYSVVGGIIRNDWLTALNLEAPKTYDDLTKVAKAFKSAYNCSTTIYLNKGLNPSGTFSDGFDLPGFSFSRTGTGFYQVDGKVQYTYTSDNFKDMLKLIQSWYQDGLISSDFITAAEGGDADTLAKQNQTGIYWSRAESITDSNATMGDTGYEVTGFANPVQKDGQVLHFSPAQNGVYNSFAVSAACENTDVLAKWLDWGYTEDGILFGNYGMEGYSYEFDENGKPQFTEAMMDREVGFKACSERYIRHAAPTVVDVGCTFSAVYDELGYESIMRWNENYDGAYDLPTVLSLTTEENDVFSADISDIETYVQGWTMQAITGKVDLDAQWDAYVTQVNDLGAQECIDIYQASYDRYLARS